MKLFYVCIVLGLAVAAACGGASSTDTSSSHGGSSTGGSSTGGGTAPGAISGVYLRHDSAQPRGGSPAAGVKIGLYTRAIAFAGPVMANPPKPLRVVLTGSGGRFAFPGLSGKRYFVAANDDHAYAIGRWAKPGARITLRGCTDCPRPM
ncbi:MAG: hypothetical protein ACTHNU_12015 [Gaiellales bacterium]